jgi:hypothetical protein
MTKSEVEDVNTTLNNMKLVDDEILKKIGSPEQRPKSMPTR